jgi:hypothetical protein
MRASNLSGGRCHPVRCSRGNGFDNRTAVVVALVTALQYPVATMLPLMMPCQSCPWEEAGKLEVPATVFFFFEDTLLTIVVKILSLQKEVMQEE